MNMLSQQPDGQKHKAAQHTK